MPTRTHSSDPFMPRGSLTREQLLAYAEGRLTPSEAHEVELHLESDPLLREAAEGLARPGGAAALASLDAMRPTTTSPGISSWWMAGGMVILLIGLALWWNAGGTSPHNVSEQKIIPEQEHVTPTAQAEPPIANTEMAAAVEQPAAQRIGHESQALHTRAVAARAQREPGIERVQPRGTELERSARPGELHRGSSTRSSRQLLFPHDLKIIDPRELYASDPQLLLDDAHVAASFADATVRDSHSAGNLTVAYTVFMDEALGRFVENDHKGCLDDLRFLLNQYPDDVNALFYAGLCSYNLGLYDRARSLLHRAATHPVDVFNEEAAWYHALTLDRLGETQAAQEAYGRIAAQDGFYSELAKGRLDPPPTIAR